MDSAVEQGRTQAPADASVSRRGVLLGGGLVGAALVVAACGGSASDSQSSSAAPTSSGAAPPVGDLGPASSIPVGGGVVFDGPKVVVTQPSSGSIKGFTAICPHQGCLVNQVADNTIICPCHGSKFSAEDGSVLQGPATTGLASVPVSVKGGEVVLG